MNFKKLTDEEVIAHAKAGDRQAWSALIDRYYRTVVGLAFAVSGNHHAARDIAQDTFVKVLRALPQLTDLAKFPGWLSTIARRTALDWRRRQRPAVSIEALTADGAEPVAPPDPSPDVYEAVHRAIRKLPASYREVFLVRHQENLSYKEIAERLGLSLSTVETRLFRARQMLAALLKPMVDSDHEPADDRQAADREHEDSDSSVSLEL